MSSMQHSQGDRIVMELPSHKMPARVTGVIAIPRGEHSRDGQSRQTRWRTWCGLEGGGWGPP